jgi:hypothetical protein
MGTEHSDVFSFPAGISTISSSVFTTNPKLALPPTRFFAFSTKVQIPLFIIATETGRTVIFLFQASKTSAVRKGELLSIYKRIEK